ncbi:MAG: methionyl aminopeptidase [Acidobacteriota bacterium]|nr:methionyl aminopeptidase [Acidobacteriota bacterium]
MRHTRLKRNDPCHCGSGLKYKKCHGRKRTTTISLTSRPKRDFEIMDAESLPKMRKVCTLSANILDEVCERVQPGTTTQQIDDWVHQMTLDAGAYPAPLNYPNGRTDPKKPRITTGGFPRSVCTSVNDVVCHGIPSENCVLKEGDILNIDVTSYLNGFHGDTSRTIYVGTPSEQAKLVTETARECLELGIQAVKPHGRLIEVGRAIYNHATKRGLGVVRDYTGHGVGRVFHAEPQVCHYPNRETDCELLPGMTFTIEPMINAGTFQTFLDKSDGWTVYTLDRKLSAQFEHTILVTETGHEILTLPDRNTDADK